MFAKISSQLNESSMISNKYFLFFSSYLKLALGSLLSSHVFANRLLSSFLLFLENNNQSNMGRHSVKLYSYDMTQIGSKINPLFGGIWHTSVVVYGYEYSYGPDGITVLGSIGDPTRIHEMGYTEISEQQLDKHVEKLEERGYVGSKYNLSSNNCNNFSDELIDYLTGEELPTYIKFQKAAVKSAPYVEPFRALFGSSSRSSKNS